MERTVFGKVFMWMFVGLMVTFGTAFYVANSPALAANILGTNLVWGLIIAQVGAVIFLSARAHKMNYGTAAVTFVAYSWLTGLTFSMFFIMYHVSSLIYVFMITAVVFGIFGLIGYFTKLDLTKIRTYLLVGLIAVILARVANIWIGMGDLDMMLTYAIIVIFVGFTAYDIQKIKRNMTQIHNQNSLAIVSALSLYLNFINLFIALLRLFGDRR